MSDLLKFIMTHCSYLFDDFGCRPVDSQASGSDALIVFEYQDLRFRFVRDRSQVFADFQNRGADGKRWYSFGVVRQLLGWEVEDSEVLDGEKADYIRSHFQEIVDMFSSQRLAKTEAMLQNLERERAKRLFG